MQFVDVPLLAHYLFEMDPLDTDEEESGDEDYVPEEESDAGNSDEGDLVPDEDDIKKEKVQELVTNKEIKPEAQEEKKKRIDNLWDDFCKDVGKKDAIQPKKSEATPKESNSSIEPKSTTCPVGVENVTSTANNQVDKTSNLISEKESENDVEKVSSSQESPLTVEAGIKRTGGLASLVSSLSKKPKFSTLNKTKIDWESYKHEEGLQETLAQHTRSKDSYIQRQAFLQRTDLRQFEVEKSVREKTRLSNTSKK